MSGLRQCWFILLGGPNNFCKCLHVFLDLVGLVWEVLLQLILLCSVTLHFLEILTHPPSHSETSNPCKKDRVETVMCHPDPLSQLKDFFFPRCCSDASIQALAISSLKNGLSWRVSSCKFMLLSQGSPHPKTGWRQWWNAIPALEPPGVRLPPRLQDSLTSPLPRVGFFLPLPRAWLIPRALSEKFPVH